MYEAGLSSVTMVQRSKTYVLPSTYWTNVSSRTYNAEIPTQDADRLQMKGPMAVSRLLARGALNAQAKKEPERFDALERAGFLTERYGDVFWHLMERVGGHYMDVGTSKKIADGKIKIKSGVAATHFIDTGLVFADGSELAADVVVFSTGFEIKLKDSINRLFGNGVADQIDQFFGIDDEGEIRGAWKIQHLGLIAHGICQGQSRYMSRFVALQIRAALEGKPLKQYTGTPVPPRVDEKKLVDGQS